MIWKAVFVVALAVGVLCENESTDAQHTQLDPVQQLCKRIDADFSSYTTVDRVVWTSAQCIMSMLNVETIKQEIEAAKNNKTLDEVFKKHCDKSTQVKTCIHTVKSIFAPCIEHSLQGDLSTLINVTDQSIDFVCFKDGERIVRFIEEQGPECLHEKTFELHECFDKMRGTVNIKADGSLTLNIEAIRTSLKTLKECSSPVPANMAEALFRISPCQSIAKI